MEGPPSVNKARSTIPPTPRMATSFLDRCPPGAEETRGGHPAPVPFPAPAPTPTAHSDACSWPAASGAAEAGSRAPSADAVREETRLRMEVDKQWARRGEEMTPAKLLRIAFSDPDPDCLAFQAVERGTIARDVKEFLASRGRVYDGHLLEALAQRDYARMRGERATAAWKPSTMGAQDTNTSPSAVGRQRFPKANPRRRAANANLVLFCRAVSEVVHKARARGLWAEIRPGLRRCLHQLRQRNAGGEHLRHEDLLIAVNKIAGLLGAIPPGRSLCQLGIRLTVRHHPLDSLHHFLHACRKYYYELTARDWLSYIDQLRDWLEDRDRPDVGYRPRFGAWRRRDLMPVLTGHSATTWDPPRPGSQGSLMACFREMRVRHELVLGEFAALLARVGAADGVVYLWQYRRRFLRPDGDRAELARACIRSLITHGDACGQALAIFHDAVAAGLLRAADLELADWRSIFQAESGFLATSYRGLLRPLFAAALCQRGLLTFPSVHDALDQVEAVLAMPAMPPPRPSTDRGRHHQAAPAHRDAANHRSFVPPPPPPPRPRPRLSRADDDDDDDEKDAAAAPCPPQPPPPLGPRICRLDGDGRAWDRGRPTLGLVPPLPPLPPRGPRICRVDVDGRGWDSARPILDLVPLPPLPPLPPLLRGVVRARHPTTHDRE
ncbi:MAG: hypothetical protein M1826_006087 [Phylliscum demangeonii]|nr:MAG: hypothetical protein M1826_006087 [Phylliscum demangeonii]